MYFLVEILLNEAALGPHQFWLFLIFLLLTLIFALATQYVRDEQGRRDVALVISTLFLAGLLTERFIVLFRYEFFVFPGFQGPAPAWWVLGRHLSMFTVELSLYALLYILLRDSLKKWLRKRLKGYLDD